MRPDRDCFFLLLSVTVAGCIDRKDNESVLSALQGTWVGELSCADEATRTTGLATLVIEYNAPTAVGEISFVGDAPSEFTTTANLELWENEGGIDGRWSDCEITYVGDYVSCHFWHEEQDNGYVFKPNTWSLSEDRSIFSIEEAGNVESEAMKCHGDLSLNTQ